MLPEEKELADAVMVAEKPTLGGVNDVATISTLAQTHDTVVVDTSKEITDDDLKPKINAATTVSYRDMVLGKNKVVDLEPKFQNYMSVLEMKMFAFGRLMECQQLISRIDYIR
ncbi:hypothetical protein GQ457_12G009980 [Hibiscus cannabinus]